MAKSINRKFFFDHAMAQLFGGSLNASKVAGLTAILDYLEASFSAKDDRWLAYMLATAHIRNWRSVLLLAKYLLTSRSERSLSHFMKEHFEMSGYPKLKRSL